MHVSDRTFATFGNHQRTILVGGRIVFLLSELLNNKCEHLLNVFFFFFFTPYFGSQGFIAARCSGNHGMQLTSLLACFNFDSSECNRVLLSHLTIQLL